MSKVSKKSLGTKLILAGVVSTAIVAIILSGITIWQNMKVEKVAEHETNALSNQVQDNILTGIMSMLLTQQEVLEDKIGHDLQTSRYLLDELGEVYLGENILTWDAVNQETKEVHIVNLPEMMAGNVSFGQNKDMKTTTPLVDHVMSMTDCTSTIFQRMNPEGDMLRIATNAENFDGTRAIGTFIPASGAAGLNEVVSTVLAGKKYTGRAFVVNQWFVSSYEPLYDENENIIGMLFVGIPEERSSTVRDKIMATTVGDTGCVFVLDRQGNYIISPEGTQDGECVWDNKCADGNYYIQHTIDAALKLEDDNYAKVAYRLNDPETGTARRRTTTVGYFAPWDWTIVAGTWESELQKPVTIIHEANSESRIRMLIILAASLVVIVILWIILARSISRPVQSAANTIKKIGEGDFSQKLNIKSQDEIGMLAKDYNTAVDHVRKLIKTIVEKTGRISSKSEELTKDIAKTTNLVSDTKKSIHTIQNEMDAQAASVIQTAATMKNITVSIENLGGHINEQSEKVAQSSSAIEQMLANISSVTRTLENNGELMNQLTNLSEQGRKDLAAVSGDINTVAAESDELLAISAVIEDIAQQTNLLSMNAAVEAAHAGESGKGFSVVAEEIRKLAESSADEAKIISSELEKIKVAIDRINQGSEAVSRQFENIDKHIRHVSEQEGTIRYAMKEQETGSKDILQAVEDLSEISKRVEAESAEMRNGSQEIITESSNLEKITEDVKKHVDLMTGNIDSISGTIERVESMTQENRDSIGVLNEEIKQFKLE